MQLDSESRWAGDALLMPRLGVHLYLESVAAMRNVSLKSAGPNQNQQGWCRLESALEDGALRRAGGSQSVRTLDRRGWSRGIGGSLGDRGL